MLLRLPSDQDLGSWNGLAWERRRSAGLRRREANTVVDDNSLLVRVGLMHEFDGIPKLDSTSAPPPWLWNDGKSRLQR